MSQSPLRPYLKSPVALILMLLTFTAVIIFNKTERYPLSNGEQLVNIILTKVADVIKEKYHIKPCGMGAAMPGGPIQQLTLCFDTRYPYTKEQLRMLLIKSSEELVNEVNKNNEIQEFLKERPFRIKNVAIIIYNHDKDGVGLKDPQISVAGISQSMLHYCTIDPEDSFKYKNEFEESYEDALKIVQDRKK